MNHLSVTLFRSHFMTYKITVDEYLMYCTDFLLLTILPMSHKLYEFPDAQTVDCTL